MVLINYTWRMAEQNDHNIEVPAGSLRLKGLKPTWEHVAKFYHDRPFWRILAGVLIVASLFIGYAVGGWIGFLIGGVVAVIVDIVPAFSGETIIVKRQG